MNEISVETAYKMGGYEYGLRIALEHSVAQLNSGVDPKVVLVRFHTAATKLRRLHDADKRLPRKRRNAKKTKQSKNAQSGPVE